MRMYYLVVLIITLPLVWSTEWCPRVCTCYRQLTTTDCSGRHLATIPIVPNVTRNLYLENNRIEHLTVGAFYATPNLVVLTLHGNQLTLLDSSTFEGLYKLQELNLSRNQLILLKVTSTVNGTLPVSTGIGSIRKSPEDRTTQHLYIFTKLKGLKSQPQYHHIGLAGPYLQDYGFFTEN